MAAHTDWVRCLSLCPSGTRLLSGSNDMSIKLWLLVRNHIAPRPFHPFVGSQHINRR